MTKKKKAIDKTFNKLNSLSKTKLKKLLDLHRDGGIAKLIKDSNMFIGEHDMTELIEKVEQWFMDRGLHIVDPFNQMMKLFEEVGELSSSMIEDDLDKIKDSIGDVLITLVGLTMQLGISIEECLSLAYEEIKDRRGSLVNGFFVKEEFIKEEKPKLKKFKIYNKNNRNAYVTGYFQNLSHARKQAKRTSHLYGWELTDVCVEEIDDQKEV